MPDGLFLRALRAAAPDPTPDADLLRRYVGSKDPAAFELLVRRHADLVWKVCHGVLRADPHAAEDAFQATFLALARKAGAVGRGEALPGWLFRVARHAALAARRRAARRPTVPFPDAVPGTNTSTDQMDLVAILGEEIDRLAAKYRSPVLLCLYEGYTHAEAAERLGWPVGTVSGRLARGREQLRRRLERRGVTLASAVLAAGLTTEGGTAAPRLVGAAVATAGGAVSPNVLLLTQGVLSAMRAASVKGIVAAACVAVGLAGTGTMVAVSQDGPPSGPPVPGAVKPPAAAPPTNPPGTKLPGIKAFGQPGVEFPRFGVKISIPATSNDRLHQQAKEQAKVELEQLRVTLQLYLTLIQGGQWDSNALFNTLQVLKQTRAAGVVVAQGQTDEVISWHEEHVSIIKWLEEVVTRKVWSGAMREQHVRLVRDARRDAENDLKQVRREGRLPVREVPTSADRVLELERMLANLKARQKQTADEIGKEIEALERALKEHKKD